MGKSSGKNFTEGWIEFEDKHVAKQVAQMLNGQPMGGKRRSAYFYDLWCLKYLSKFKWDHLTEEIGEAQPFALAPSLQQTSTSQRVGALGSKLPFRAGNLALLVCHATWLGPSPCAFAVWSLAR